MNTQVPDAVRNRNRGMLVLIVVFFLGSALVAGALRFSGWRPEGTRNHGELLQPPGDLRDVVAHLEVLVAIECELMDDGAPIDDRVELDRDLGSQMPNGAHAGIAGFEAT
mgnify:CR=1 FL=1